MIELKITGDALEVKGEIEKLFNMTSGAPVKVAEPAPLVKVEVKETEEVIKQNHELDAVEQKKVQDEIPEVDSRGFPWDERIHASSKAINADGTWRNKRGVDSDLLHTVEAELMGDAEPVKTDAEPVKTDAEPVKTDAEPVKTDAEPVKTDAEPVKEYTDKDVTSSMIKMVTALGAVDGSIISPVTQKVLGKFNASAITDIKEQSDRAEFVRICEAIADNPSQWETIL